jgi:Family of unknown function (DUF5985)
MDLFLIGAIAMASFVAGLFFLRFWRDTGDRLFFIFAIAFWLLGLTRLALVLIGSENRGEEHTYLYWVRFAAFLLILLAIIDKNRPKRENRPPHA